MSFEYISPRPAYAIYIESHDFLQSARWSACLQPLKLLRWTAGTVSVHYISRASIHYTGGRLTTRSREVSKPRDSGLDCCSRSGIWQAPRQQRCRDACQISERFDHYDIKSRGFETSRDLAVRSPSAEWFEAQKYSMSHEICTRLCCALLGLCWHPLCINGIHSLISLRVTSLVLDQSSDFPCVSEETPKYDTPPHKKWGMVYLIPA